MLKKKLNAYSNASCKLIYIKNIISINTYFSALRSLRSQCSINIAFIFLYFFNYSYFFLDPSAVHHPFNYEASLKTELSQYLATSETGSLFKAFVEKIPKERRRSIEYIVYLNQLVFNRIRYLVRYEPGVQTAEQTLN